MTTYANKSNCIRAARKALGTNAKLGTDFLVTDEKGAFSWAAIAKSPAPPPVDDGLEIPACLRMTPAERKAGRDKAAKEAMERADKEREVSRAAKAATAASKPTKISLVLHAALSAQGITNAGIREMTGWKRLGGFFTACKRNKLTMRRVREDGDTRWFATTAST